MRTSPWLLGCVCGALSVTVFLVACSDDTTGDADAAVCDCPAAEPPLAGRIVQVRNTLSINPGGIPTSNEAICAEGSMLIGGGCSQESEVVQSQLVLVHAGRLGTMERGPWRCSWRNDSAAAISTVVEAVCLVPAE